MLGPGKERQEGLYLFKKQVFPWKLSREDFARECWVGCLAKARATTQQASGPVKMACKNGLSN